MLFMKMNLGRVLLGFGCGTWWVQALKLLKLFEAGLGGTGEGLMGPRKNDFPIVLLKS